MTQYQELSRTMLITAFITNVIIGGIALTIGQLDLNEWSMLVGIGLAAFVGLLLQFPIINKLQAITTTLQRLEEDKPVRLITKLPGVRFPKYRRFLNTVFEVKR